MTQFLLNKMKQNESITLPQKKKKKKKEKEQEWIPFLSNK